MIRHVLAFILGGIAGSIANMALVHVSNIMYPLPEGIDPSNLDAIRAHVQAHGFPTGALLIVLAAHAGGSFVSGLVCGLIAMRPWYIAAIILGLLWTCGGVAMLFLLPAPIWFAVVDVILYVPAAILGVKLGSALISGRSPQVAVQPT